MSYSSLYVMDNNFNGFKAREFTNSWLFTPVVMDVLGDKYVSESLMTPFGKFGLMSAAMSNRNLFNELNEKVNECDVFEDRICWEMSNQQVFASKDKQVIANAISDFVVINQKHMKEYGEHILERFQDLANEIMQINEAKYPYFAHKNTSCDDNVENWFLIYNEEIDDCEECSLRDAKESKTEFVIIEGKELSFVSNLEFFKGAENES